MQNKLYWIWLSRLAEKINIQTLHNLLSIYKEPENIWKLSKKELEKSINTKDVDEIQKIEYRQNLENYLFYMNKAKIDIIAYKDKRYPEKLKNIYDPPIAIYIKGNQSILNEKSIGIVGCRNCSSYGKKMSQDFSYNLAKNNFVIVSGLARGIDTYAHIGCIKAKGKTIAVMGSGVDIMYPPENEEISKNIIQSGGAIISEYLPRNQTKARKLS